MPIRVALLVAAALTVAACTATVDGTGRAADGVTGSTTGPSTATRPPTSPIPPPTVPPAPTSPKVTRPPADPLAVPPVFGGTWRGTMNQPGSLIPRWTAVIAFSIGDVRGSFSIQGFCSGFADVVAVSGTKMVIQEQITSDPSGKCADLGVVELVPAGKDRVRARWVDGAQSTNVATGTLTRA